MSQQTLNYIYRTRNQSSFFGFLGCGRVTRLKLLIYIFFYFRRKNIQPDFGAKLCLNMVCYQFVLLFTLMTPFFLILFPLIRSTRAPDLLLWICDSVSYLLDCWFVNENRTRKFFIIAVTEWCRNIILIYIFFHFFN